MNLSISPTATFFDIDWESLENRPVIDSSMPLCTSDNWEYDVPCCIDGYAISDALEMASLQQKENTLEAIFLSNYPCLNSPEFEDITSDFTMYQSEFLEAKNPTCSNFASKVFNSLKRLFS